MRNLLRDLRYALRQLRKSPGFAITAVLTLALGIGANVVVFSVLNALILRPLNVPHPGNLYQVVHRRPGWDVQSYPDFLDFKDHNTVFRGMAAYSGQTTGFGIGTLVSKSWGDLVSGNYFDLLGVRPALGRFFHAADEHGYNSAPYVVLSYDFWNTRFNDNPRVIGTTVYLNKHPFTVIGVAPKSFHGTELFLWPDFFAPMVDEEQVGGSNDLPYRDHYYTKVIGRLKPGITPQRAANSLNALATQMGRQNRKDDGLNVRLIRPGLLGDASSSVRAFLLGIMLLAFLVLLAACANLASIFAARAADRGRELAIRLAVGSSRWHVLLQLLVEALLVSVAGGAAGTFFASGLLEALGRWQPFSDAHVRVLAAPDARVYVLALLLSVASDLLFGLFPSPQIWRTDAASAMKSGSTETAAFRRFSLRDLLLAVQIALCTLLVTASLVAVRGMERSLRAPLGVQARNIMLAETDLQMAGYSSDQSLLIQKHMLQDARSIPGVTAAAIGDHVPLISGSQWFVYPQGTTEFIPPNRAFSAFTYLISPNYLQTVGTQLLTGRDFTWHDDSQSPYVAIVNETFARKLFGNKPAVGRHFLLWASKLYEVVGVVEDGKYGSLTEQPRPAMFFPLAQGVGGVKSTSTTLIVRSKLPPGEMAAALRRVLSDVDPSLPLMVRSWRDALDPVLFPAEVAAAALGIMGLLAAMLAVTGIFGMAAYSVSKRMKELGIRIALGAQPEQLMRSALGRPLLLLLSGSIAGLVLGVLASRLLAQIVYEATPRDPIVMLGVIGTMALLGLLATWIPARRALHIDPIQLLREE